MDLNLNWERLIYLVFYDSVLPYSFKKTWVMKKCLQLRDYTIYILNDPGEIKGWWRPAGRGPWSRLKTALKRISN